MYNPVIMRVYYTGQLPKGYRVGDDVSTRHDAHEVCALRDGLLPSPCPFSSIAKAVAQVGGGAAASAEVQGGCCNACEHLPA